jgi:IS5 family transposase
MSWKVIGQTATTTPEQPKHQALQELDGVNALIDWGSIEAKLSDIHASERGEKAWPPLMMFKALLLQCWYNLSDPGLEKHLVRDLLFRSFVGLSSTDAVPDHSTIWRFRQQLAKEGRIEILFREINDQLSQHGLFIKEGSVSIIDASVIEAKQCRPHKNKAGESTQDPEAGWNVKNASDGKSKTTYGFKLHANVDEDGFVKAIEVTAGNVHDSQMLKPLLEGDEAAVYGDSAYKSQGHDEYLENQETENRIIRRAYRNRPLSAEDKRFNRRHSGVRSIVERVFGIFKQHYGMAKARYLGVVRNQTRYQIMCMAYNLKRGVAIQREMCA